MRSNRKKKIVQTHLVAVKVNNQMPAPQISTQIAPPTQVMLEATQTGLVAAEVTTLTSNIQRF